MDKLKKDFIIFYLARNAVATFIITLCSFVYDFSKYFNITIVRAIIKIFTENIYITTYFLLLWILNYLLFEMYKIIIDTFRNDDKTHAKITINDKHLVAYGTIIPLIILIVIIIIDFNQLFKINFILLSIFMLIRSIKEEIKYYNK
ncbi:hypothetical protein [Thomasclavelia sp.]